MIEIDELVEIWVGVHKEAHDDDLSWWREALANAFARHSRMSEILEDEESGRKSN